MGGYASKIGEYNQNPFLMHSNVLTKLALAAMLLLVVGQVPNLINATPPPAAPTAASSATHNASTAAFTEPFVGTISMFAGNFAPRGWARCDGQLLPISQYQALFSILGTTYGGNGRTTFGLPDLRGRVPVHPGNGPGLSPVRLGQTGGAEFYTLTQQHLPSHTHNATVTLRAGQTNGDIKANADGRILMSSGRGGTPIYTTAAASSELRQDGASVQVGNTGQGQAFDNKQPYQAVNYIIALEGLYPSRN